MGTCPIVTIPKENMLSLWRFENNMLDSSGNGNHITCSGMCIPPITFEGGQVGQSVKFPHAPVSYKAPSTINPIEQITVEGWIKIIPDPSAFLPYVLGKYIPEVSGAWLLYADTQCDVTRPALDFTVFSTNPGPPLSVRERLPETDQLVHFAATFDGYTVKMYYNGELKDSSTPLTSPAQILPSNADILFSNDDNQDSAFNGSFDELSVYDIALTAEQVCALWSEGLNGNVKTENVVV